jgi:glycosyltransferase involved in cell wall biosynthesis
LLVNSPAYRDYLLQKGIPAQKISVIPNGADPDMFAPSDKGEQVRQQYGLAGKFVVTYAGALGLANDIPVVLRAARRLKDNSDIHIMLVGDGKERANLERQVEEWGLDNITFVGPRPKQEMKQFLAASDVGLAILRDIRAFRMTYPNKVFDYMAAGRPTVLAIDGVIREVVESANGGVFVPPGDDEKMATILHQMSQQPQKVAAMGLSARDYVTNQFNRSDQARKFVELAESLSAK